eukprot:6178014-Pleurochrysis_carterae.AAC.2
MRVRMYARACRCATAQRRLRVAPEHMRAVTSRTLVAECVGSLLQTTARATAFKCFQPDHLLLRSHSQGAADAHCCLPHPPSLALLVRRLQTGRGVQIEEAGPSAAVEIVGLNGLPAAGDSFVVTPDESKARQIAEARAARFTHTHTQRTLSHARTPSVPHTVAPSTAHPLPPASKRQRQRGPSHVGRIRICTRMRLRTREPMRTHTPPSGQRVRASWRVWMSARCFERRGLARQLQRGIYRCTREFPTCALCTATSALRVNPAPRAQAQVIALAPILTHKPRPFGAHQPPLSEPVLPSARARLSGAAAAAARASRVVALRGARDAGPRVVSELEEGRRAAGPRGRPGGQERRAGIGRSAHVIARGAPNAPRHTAPARSALLVSSIRLFFACPPHLLFL